MSVLLKYNSISHYSLNKNEEKNVVNAILKVYFIILSYKHEILF